MTGKGDAKIYGGGFFQISDRMHLEDKNADSYWDRIKPTLATEKEYFETVEPKEEWHRRREEETLSDFYGSPIKVTI